MQQVIDAAGQRPRLPALDGLRAVAVFVVIAFHGGLPIPGDLGVTAFFVLSGFLITWLMLREIGETGSLSFRQFFLRRALRILPAYYAFLAASIVADGMLGDHWSPGNLWAALTYTLNYYQAANGHNAHVAHAWSLAIEEQFYLIWPVFIVVFARYRLLLTGTLFLVIAVCSWRMIAYLGIGLPKHYVYNALDTRLDSLAIGGLLAIGEGSATFARVTRRLSARAIAPLFTIGALAVSRVGIGLAYHFSAGFTIDSLLVALLLVQLRHLHSHPGWRWLDHPVALWLGAISYPLYLWHVQAFTLAHWLALPFPGELAVGTLIAIAVAAGSYYAIERPCLALRAPLASMFAARPKTAGRTSAAEGPRLVPPPTLATADSCVLPSATMTLPPTGLGHAAARAATMPPPAQLASNQEMSARG